MTSTTLNSMKVATLAAVSALALAACGGGGGGPGASASQSGEIDPNAVLTVTTAAPVRTLDPHLQTSYGSRGFLTPIYDRLTMVDPAGNIVPGLAASWEFVDDGAALEMVLRDDVTFNDGTPFDAAAVAANIERGKSLDGSTVVAALSDIASVDIVDPHRVRLNLNEGKGVALPSKFATNVGMMISPAVIESGTDIQNGPGMAGSGAYLVDKFVPQESLDLVRADDDYWDENGGRLAGMTITSIPDAATRINGIRTGVTDLTWVSSANEVVEAQNLAKQGSYQVEEVEFRNVLGVMMRPKGDLENKDVREAVARAIDPEAISALFSGTCTPYRQMEPANSWASSDKEYEYPFSFDKAQASSLVKDAGSAKVELSFAAGSNTEKPANVIQSQLAEVGMEATLNAVPSAQAEPRNIAGEFQAYVANSFSPEFDPAETVDRYITGAYGFGDGDPEIAELATRAAEPTLPQDERAALYKQIWDKTLEKAMFIPICHQTNATVASQDVVGVADIPWVSSGIFDLRTVAIATN